jgi:hypothetical protein
MSVAKQSLVAALSPKLPAPILNRLLDDYQEIKQQFFLKKFQPSELNGARFCESVLRLIEYLDSGQYTDFGRQLGTDPIIRRVENNTTLPDTLRFLIPRLTRVVLDVRNKRDVAHVGGEVNANFSDALFVTHSADWILTELVRHYYSCPIEEAKRIVTSLNQVRIPVVADVDGFLRVQNTKLDTKDKTLVLLYHKQPSKVNDSDLSKWIRYQNISRYKTAILKKLDDEALIHYEGGSCTLLEKGILYVEKNIPLDLLI